MSEEMTSVKFYFEAWCCGLHTNSIHLNSVVSERAPACLCFLFFVYFAWLSFSFNEMFSCFIFRWTDQNLIPFQWMHTQTNTNTLWRIHSARMSVRLDLFFILMFASFLHLLSLTLSHSLSFSHLFFNRPSLFFWEELIHKTRYTSFEL